MLTAREIGEMLQDQDLGLTSWKCVIDRLVKKIGVSKQLSRSPQVWSRGPGAVFLNPKEAAPAHLLIGLNLGINLATVLRFKHAVLINESLHAFLPVERCVDTQEACSVISTAC